MDFSVDKASTVLSQSPDGDHYKGFVIEPIQYTEANKLGFHEGNIVKYVTRWKLKNGIRDLKKARFYLDRLIQIEERRKPDPPTMGPPITATPRSGMGHEPDPTRANIYYDHTTSRFVTGDPGDETQIRPGIDFPR